MKKIFSILAIAALMAGCSKEDSTTDVAPATFTLTGYTSNDTRTAFDTPDNVNNKIPFVWSEGDKIWSGSEKSTEAVINNDGSASFTFASEPESTIYYNMTGTSATQANVPASQSIANNLGQNGDFGYATVEDGEFTLSHATAYLWFNTTTSIANATLETVSVNADGVNIAGKATWNVSEFGVVSEGSSEVTLTIGQPLSATNENVWAMVVLPANLSDKSVKVVYKLNVGGNTKYYTQTLSGKELPAGRTQKISANISEAQLTDYRELRVLTFEDEDTKFETHDIVISYYDWDIYDNVSYPKTIAKWSDYIPTDGQYGNMHNLYSWHDAGNTELACTNIISDYGMGAGHAGISNFVGTNYQEQGNHMYDLQAYNVDGGANGSDNFCTQFGYVDPPQYEFENSPQGLPNLYFHDGIARVIDHMYVTNTTYAYNILVSGEQGFGGSYEFTDDSQFWVVAYGYETDEDEDPTVVKFCLLDKGKQIVTDWTKWDLTGLGKVVKVEFNLEAGDNGYGEYGLVIPGYFAYDDIAVQF
ncbi:MAG: DUF4465 domain-containing protein [Alistipes sp.]|nr:DUF4465 domain-containing protein [Alistipes sp.]